MASQNSASSRRRSRAKTMPRSVTKPRGPRNRRPAYIVGIGGSAGGLEAFQEFFSRLPPDSGLAFVLIPHLDPTHKGMMPEIIARSTKMPVFEATDGAPIRANSVYIIPPNKSMRVIKGRLELDEFTVPRGMRSPIDCFLDELAKDQGSCAIAIILSGMGTDGTQGLRTVKENFGLAMVQDPKTARYDSMPQAAIDTGLVDYVLPVGDMPGKLLAYVALAGRSGQKPSLSERTLAHNLTKIFALLRTHTDHDFSLYKRSTIHRRVERRMHLHQLHSLSKYVQLLETSPHEIELLLKELLIGVTGFFRDPDSFAVLAEKALPTLVRGKVGNTLRVWVAGCSTGEEAYSLAMVLAESVEQQKLEGQVHIQIFATDVNKEAVDRARQGFYGEEIEANISPERLRRYCAKEDHGYRIHKRIRETVVFAPQNMIMDPPFTKVDLISCRNVLIYLTAELQKKLLPLFHYSLAPGGLLFLGSAETIGTWSDLFVTVDAKWKIYRRRETPGVRPNRTPPGQVLDPVVLTGPKRHNIGTPRQRPLPEVSRELLLHHFAPPAVLVNEAGDILYIHGKTGKFLEPASGEASLNLFSMAREGLRLELAGLIRKAHDQKQDVVARDVRIETNGTHGLVTVKVHPLSGLSGYRGLLLVAFEAVQASKPVPGKSMDRPRKTGKRVRELEQELALMGEQLNSTMEAMETSQEELKSANEELQSMNEELQSTNEELTTSKEEMQSMNEELVTVNAELQDKIEDLSQSNSDMKNLLNSTDLATVFVDNELNVKRFTPQTAKVINLIPTDVGRPLSDLATSLKYDRLSDDVVDVIENLATKEIQVETKTGQWFLMRIGPYRTLDNVIDGAVLTFTNITSMKALEQSLAEKEDLVRRVLERMPVMLAALGPDRTVTVWNSECERVTGYRAAEVVGNPAVLVWLVPDPAYRTELLTERRRLAGQVRNWEVRITCKDGTTRTIALSNVSTSVAVRGWSEWGIAMDITARSRKDGARSLSE